MLQKKTLSSAPQTGSSSAASQAAVIDWQWIVGAVVFNRWLVILLTVAITALAVAYVIFRPSVYTATTALEIANLQLKFSPQNEFFADTLADTNFLETQVQILQSEGIALRVAKDLNAIPTQSADDETLEVLRTFQRGLNIERRGVSNVLGVSYSAPDPDRAALIANAFAQSYIADQNLARAEAAQAGTGWLREKLRQVGPKARVLTEALPPKHKSQLRGIFLIAGAAVVGGFIGVGAALLRGLVDGRIRTPEQTTSATGVQCIGIVPDLGYKLRNAKVGDIQTSFSKGEFCVQSAIDRAGIENPVSEFALTLRQTSAVCDEIFSSRGARYLGVISTFPGEGRSMIALNLARSMAASGRRVLLVDCDIYHPSLSQKFASKAVLGIVNFVSCETSSLDSFVLRERETGLHLLPIGTQEEGNPERLWTDAMGRFLAETSTAYDDIIFDLPCLAMMSEVRSAARFLDGFLFVVGWNHVTSQNVRVAIETSGAVSDRLIGTILNRAKVAAAWSIPSSQISFYNQRAKIIRQALQGGDRPFCR